MIKRALSFFIAFEFCSFILLADEGMFIPSSIPDSVFNVMKRAGLNLSKEELFSNDTISLSTTIAKINKGCSSGVISKDGLIITNYHCSRFFIKQKSTEEDNLLESGFIAKSFSEELYCSGISVQIYTKIIDVTSAIEGGIPSDATIKLRDSLIKKNTKELIASYNDKQGSLIKVEPFYNGSKFLLYVSEEFNDIRLVFCPPQNIAEFGIESDNWQWPRHNADFAIFRIYVDSFNNPAKHNQQNIPYKPQKYLSPSIKEKKENDFVLVLGFPGKTDEYLTSNALKQYRDSVLPTKLFLCEKRINCLSNGIKKDKAVEFKYKDKYLELSNYYQNCKSVYKSLMDSDLLKTKNKYNQSITSGVLESLDSALRTSLELKELSSFYLDGILNIEAVKIALKFQKYTSDSIKIDKNVVDKLQNYSRSFYKTYNAGIDLGFYNNILPFILKFQSTRTNSILQTFKNVEISDKCFNSQHIMCDMFENSFFLDSNKLNSILALNPVVIKERIKNDFICKMAVEAYDRTVQLELKQHLVEKKIDSILRLNMNTLKSVNEFIYPDANSTLRVSYGFIKSYEAEDATIYNFKTTLNGIFEKYKTGYNQYSTDSSFIDKIKTNKDTPACFIMNCHTTGGNSGSPVIDGNGNMIGLNMDRNIDGCVNDYVFNQKKGRNIALDTRYIYFILKDVSNAEHVLNSIQFTNH